MRMAVVTLSALVCACGPPDRRSGAAVPVAPATPTTSATAPLPTDASTPSDPTPADGLPVPDEPPLVFDAIGGPRHAAAWGDPLPAGALVRLGTTRIGDDSFRYLAVSHDGRHLATCNFYGDLVLWDAATALPLRGIGKVEHCAGLLFTRDDRTLLAISYPRVDRVDVATGRVEEGWSLAGDVGSYDAFTHDVAEVPGSGDVALARCSRDADGALVVYSATGERRQGLGGFEQDMDRYCAQTVRFSPDGKLIAAGDTRRLAIYDRASGRRLREVALFYAAPLAWTDRLYVTMGGAINALDPATLEAQVSFGFVRQHAGPGFVGALPLPDGRLLAAGGDDVAGVRLYDAGGAELARWPLAFPYQLAATRDGKTGLVLVDHPAGLIARIELATGKRLGPFDLGRHGGPVAEVRFRADGAALATAAGDGTSRIWDAATGAPTTTFAPQAGPALDAGAAVVYLPDGSLLSAGGECELFRWDAERRTIIARVPMPDVERCAFEGVTVDPARRRAAIVATRRVGADERAGFLRVLDLDTNQLLPPVPVPGSGRFVGPLVHGDRLLVTSGQALLVLDAASGALRTTVALLRGPASIALLPGDEVAVGASGGPGSGVDRVPLDGRPARPLKLPEERRVGAAVAVAPDGKRLAISANDTVLIYDLPGDRVERTLTGHRSDVEALAYSADGARLAAGAADGTVLVWSTRTKP